MRTSAVADWPFIPLACLVITYKLELPKYILWIFYTLTKGFLDSKQQDP